MKVNINFLVDVDEKAARKFFDRPIGDVRGAIMIWAEKGVRGVLSENNLMKKD